jgi:hypothetical protein
MKLACVFTAAVVAAFATPAISATQAECDATWKTADAKQQGSLTEADAPRYFAAMRVANKTVPEGRISKDVFYENCMAGTLPGRRKAG